MRKDYTAPATDRSDETAFVERYWTEVWDKQGGPKGAFDAIPSKAEYRLMKPYLAGLEKGARILDGGCGLGDWTLRLTQEGYRALGLDLSRETVARLQARFPEAEFAAGDIRATGFPDGSFDAYFSWGVFEHFEEGQQRCVAEAWRVLKPGGLLFVSVPFDNLRLALRARLEGGQERADTRFYQWRLTRGELRRELTRAGFDVLRVTPIHKRQGVLRSLHHELGLPSGWIGTRALAAGLALVLPGELFGHMLFAAAKKPAQA